jgi:hypothetical protein
MVFVTKTSFDRFFQTLRLEVEGGQGGWVSHQSWGARHRRASDLLEHKLALTRPSHKLER